MAMRLKASELEKTYTIEEFEQLPEFDDHYELVDGRLVKKPVPVHEHGWIADIIRDTIKAYDPKRKLGYSLQEVSVRIDPKNSPIPDVSYWKAARNVERTNSIAPLPDLAVEVLSPSDTKSKVTLESAMVKVYRLLTAGVSIVWVVNPKEKNVKVYHAGQVEPVQTLGPDKNLDGEDIIPGFTLPVRALFEDQ